MILSEEGGNTAEEDIVCEVKLESGKKARVTVGLPEEEIKKRRKKSRKRMKGHYNIKVDISTESPALTGREANEMACHILTLAAKKRRKCGCNRPYTFLSTVSEVVKSLIKQSHQEKQ